MLADVTEASNRKIFFYWRITMLLNVLLMLVFLFLFESSPAKADIWKQKQLIITFWSPPPPTDKALSAVFNEGFNLTWTAESGLDAAQKHGLKAMLQDNLLTPSTLNNQEKRAKLDALIKRVQKHPALEAYHIVDEPSATDFPGLGKLVAYLRGRDPSHVVYINLFPIYASNKQLGTKGEPLEAYRAYLRRYIEEVKPSLISYDHYHFFKNRDGNQYFLNLETIRQAALEAGVPFVNIVQASTILKEWRLVTSEELRWLVYTTLVYGGRGISYFLYWGPTAYGGLYQDGKKTLLMDTVSTLNKEILTQDKILMALDNLGTYHTASLPTGTKAVPASSPVQFVGPGDFILGLFGTNKNITTFMVVNRDYKSKALAQISLNDDVRTIDKFDRESKKWRPCKQVNRDHVVSVQLNPGDGRIFRIIRKVNKTLVRKR